MAHAQYITGHIIDENGTPLEFASVSIINDKDSTFVSGCITNEAGEFNILRTSPRMYLLKVTFLGYKDFYRKLPTSICDAGNIKMEPTGVIIGEVTVKGKKSFYQNRNGSLVTNVAGTVLGQIHEMDELVAQIPGIVKTANGDFEIFGSGKPIVYINNKKIQNISELKMLSPNEIKNIELITNPGAKYDAEGKSVLKIVTLKREDGISFQAGINEKQNDDNSYGWDFKVGYKRGKINMSAKYGYANSKNRSDLPQSKTLLIDDNAYNFVQGQKSKGKLVNNEWDINVDYEINESHNIGMKWNASCDKDMEYRSSILKYTLNDELIQASDIINDYQNKIKFNHLNIFHNCKWNNKLATEFNLDYANNKNEYWQDTDERISNKTTQILSTGKSMLNIYSGKLAFEYDFGHSVGMSWGLEYNHIKGSGKLSANSNTLPASDYTNEEDKYATYLELNVRAGNISVQGGLRFEDQETDYDDRINKEESVHRSYKNIYPSFSLSHDAKGWSNAFSFSSRTSLPTFRQLSNSSYYSNEFMYQRGNPLLKPSDTYIAQWNTIYKFMHFSANYTYVKNYITTDFYTPENGNTQIISSYTNYDKIQYIKANLNLQKTIGCWRPSLNIGLIKPFFTCEYRSKKISCNKEQIYIAANQYFTLQKSCLISAYYYLCNGGNQGAVELKPFQMLNLGVQKSYFDGKINISINARDIFHTMKYKETERIKNIIFQQTEDYCLWNYSISIIYRLNKDKVKYRGKTSIGNEIERL